MSVTDELDALIEELDQAVGDETGADATDGSSAVGAPDSATHASAADALDLILTVFTRASRYPASAPCA